MNKYTHPLRFIPEELDMLRGELAELKQEIRRLEKRKADKRGRKPAE